MRLISIFAISNAGIGATINVLFDNNYSDLIFLNSLGHDIKGYLWNEMNLVEA